MGREQRVRAVAEVAVWWVVLAGVWLVLIGSLDALELAVGGGAALVAALAGRAARHEGAARRAAEARRAAAGHNRAAGNSPRRRG